MLSVSSLTQKMYLSRSEILLTRVPAGQIEQRVRKTSFTTMKKNSCFPYGNKMFGIFYVIAF